MSTEGATASRSGPTPWWEKNRKAKGFADDAQGLLLAPRGRDRRRRASPASRRKRALLSSTSAGRAHPRRSIAAINPVRRHLRKRFRADYVEKPDEQKLIEAAINGMVSSLDPHSAFLDAKSCRDMDVDMRGQARRPRHRGHHGGRCSPRSPSRSATRPAFQAGIPAGDIIRQDRRRGGQGLGLNQPPSRRCAASSTPQVKLPRSSAPSPSRWSSPSPGPISWSAGGRGALSRAMSAISASAPPQRADL